MILALDPSATCTGYAVLDGPDRLVDGGRLLPARERDPFPDRMRAMLYGPEGLANVLLEHNPTDVIVEITSGKVARNRHKGGGAGLGVYGMAVGWCVGYLEAMAPQRRFQLHLILENDWTARWSKTARHASARAKFPGYAAFAPKDKGGDVSDAICLGCWWLEERELAGRTRGPTKGAKS